MAGGPDWIDRLRDIVGTHNIVIDESDIEPFSHDEFASDEFNQAPLVVVRPSSE